MSARTRGWVESWNRAKRLHERDLKEYLLNKCRNGYQVAKKPARNQKDAWVILLAEPDKTAEQLSPLAKEVVAYVRGRLEQEGYDFALNLEETGGVAYAELHFRSLTKKSRPPGSAAADTARPTSRFPALSSPRQVPRGRRVLATAGVQGRESPGDPIGET